MSTAAPHNRSILAGLAKAAPALLLLIALAAVPAAGLGHNAIRLLFITLVWVTASVGWNILGGFAGQVSFGFAVFYGLGAYAAAISFNAGAGRIPSILIGACVAVPASLLIGLPTFRLQGPYFAIATIGVSEATRVVMNNLAITGGSSGYRIMEKGAFNQLLHFYLALGLAAVAVAVSMLVRYSKFGLALIAIREDQEAASDLGVNPFTSKLLAHALAAALTGAAGGVYVGYAAFIYPQGVFGFDISVAILLMPIIGGVGTVWGPVIGAVVYGLVHEELIASFPEFHLLLYGSLLILIILFEPGGVVGMLQKLFRFVRKRS
ncbi:MAG: branched-chain amino acid ABC transporter permease [Candidatus Acidiferrales bacterium]